MRGVMPPLKKRRGWADPKRTQNGPETDPQRTRNGPSKMCQKPLKMRVTSRFPSVFGPGTACELLRQPDPSNFFGAGSFTIKALESHASPGTTCGKSTCYLSSPHKQRSLLLAVLAACQETLLRIVFCRPLLSWYHLEMAVGVLEGKRAKWTLTRRDCGSGCFLNWACALLSLF